MKPFEHELTICKRCGGKNGGHYPLCHHKVLTDAQVSGFMMAAEMGRLRDKHIFDPISDVLMQHSEVQEKCRKRLLLAAETCTACISIEGDALAGLALVLLDVARDLEQMAGEAGGDGEP